ncbi:formyl-coenzyme A transferase [Martensiomyces pterosporus]|nr:formyl-coenzyme A transferase [Martensiomyces pterosporus]
MSPLRQVTSYRDHALASANAGLHSTSAPAATASGPLSGIRVLDMTRILAGPYCTMLLGDLGAEVIKVEHPTRGDDTRTWGPPFKGYEHTGSTSDHTSSMSKGQLYRKPPQFPGESAYYLNKRSIAVNMKKETGRQILLDLAREADVLVENYVPGKLAEYGLGYEDLKSVNPRLIYTSITGYGSTGPYSKKPGYDVIIEAEAGLMHITGEESGPPVKVGVAVTDIMTGLYAHGAIMAALIARSKSNEGQHLDVSLIQTQAAILANIGSNYLIGGNEASRWGTRHPSIVPYQVFSTRDGSVCIGAGNDIQFRALSKLLGRPELAADPRFCTNADRVKNREELVGIINGCLSGKTTQATLDLLDGSGLPFGPVNNIEQTFAHPQVVSRKVVREIDHPFAGKLRIVGPAVEYSASHVDIRLPPPMLGQHTEEILRSVLGYSDGQVESAVRSGGAALYDYGI